MALTPRDLAKLSLIHPDLSRVVLRAASFGLIDFLVLEGIRSTERQRELVASGASQTLNSRHLTGHAVDLGAVVGGHLRWDWPLYDRLAGAMKRAARELAIPVEWGGDWTNFKDGPHFQLPWKAYPLPGGDPIPPVRVEARLVDREGNER